MATTKGGYYKDAYEDFENDYMVSRSQRSGGQVKTKHQTDRYPDKYETLKRLEREKKAIQKKLYDDEDERQKRQIKHKRSSKTNWTKQYEYGMLDDDDFSDYDY